MTGADRVLGGREVVHGLDSAPDETTALDAMADNRLPADEARLVIETVEEILALDSPREETATLDRTAEEGFPEEER